jgi:hypothetical protein
MTIAGNMVSLERPSDAELNRHLLMLISSLLHETEHIATDIFLNPDSHDSSQSTTSDASGCMSPARNLILARKRSTPLHIGTYTFDGQDGGDSGFELEDIIFGGRLAHMDRGIMPFEVNLSDAVLDVCISTKMLVDL